MLTILVTFAIYYALDALQALAWQWMTSWVGV